MAINREEEGSRLGITLLTLLVLIPLLLLILLFATRLYIPIGAALGVNIHRSDQLKIYDATCWQEANVQRLYVAYWSQEAAPMVVRMGDTESPLINAPAGLNTLDLTLRDREACPEEITLIDRSRNRMAGSAVERLATNG